MGRALLGIVVAACTCLLALWLLTPRLLSPGSSGTSPASTPSAASVYGATTVPASSALPPITATAAPGTENALPSIAPLVSPEQKAIQDYEAQRAPFYAFLRDKCASLIADGRPSDADRALLVLYTARNDDHVISDILTQIVTPYAYAYGFRHVRFYLPNPSGGVERYHLAAEAQASAPNTWQAFQK